MKSNAGLTQDLSGMFFSYKYKLESLTYVRCLTSYKQRLSSSMLKSPVRAVFLCSVAKVRKVYSKCNKSLLSDYDGDDGYTDKCVGNRVIITNFIL